MFEITKNAIIAELAEIALLKADKKWKAGELQAYRIKLRATNQLLQAYHAGLITTT